MDWAAERLARLRLARSRRVGPQTWQRLMAEHGDAAAALAALPEIAAAAGDRHYVPCAAEAAEAELAAGDALGAHLVTLGEDAYPARLTEIPDPPPVLWQLGDATLAARRQVALVGARNASAMGRRMAGLLAAEAGAAGLVVTSGLARGIDAAAHTAALPTGTVAVLAGGIDVTYPLENAALQARIAAEGLLVAESPPGVEPQARHFPRRNRIVSGLADGLVVVEGTLKSGSMITAARALEQGRDVMAVPGAPLDPRAGGPNALIRDGAALIRSGADILEALDAPRGLPLTSPPAAVRRRGARPGAAPDAAPVAAPDAEPGGEMQAILDALTLSPVSEDQVIRAVGLPSDRVAVALLDLELQDLVLRHPGRLVSLAPPPGAP